MTDEELHKLKDTSTLRTQKPKQLRRQGEVVELNPVDEYRRVYGAFELTKLKPFLLENNHSLHVITGGHWRTCRQVNPHLNIAHTCTIIIYRRTTSSLIQSFRETDA